MQKITAVPLDPARVLEGVAEGADAELVDGVAVVARAREILREDVGHVVEVVRVRGHPVVDRAVGVGVEHRFDIKIRNETRRPKKGEATATHAGPCTCL